MTDVTIQETDQTVTISRDPETQTVSVDESGGSVTIDQGEKQEVIVYGPDEPSVTVQEEAVSVTVDSTSVDVVEVATEGPQGPAGDASLEITATAKTALGGHRAVIVTDGEAEYADKDNPAHAGSVVGITKNAASAGASVSIVFGGEMSEPSWAFNAGPVYVGNDGNLIQARPSTGVVINIGVALAPTKLFINRTVTIQRS